MTLKKGIQFIHLWLGLISGALVFIVSITGAIYAFEEEISDWAYPYRTVAAQNAPEISVEQIKTACAPYLSHINAIYYETPGRAIRVRERGKTPDGNRYNKYVYLQPYTAEVLHTKTDDSKTFFDIVIGLHINLLLGDAGSYMVKYGTLIFLIILISGMYLWWPKNKKSIKQRFTFDWKNTTRWKRKNFDLHAVLGFYTCWVVFFAVITGLAWSFEWMDKAIYKTATLGAPYKKWEEIHSVSDTLLTPTAVKEDWFLQQAIMRYGKPYSGKRFYFPGNEQGAYSVYFTPTAGLYYKDVAYFFDQHTGDLLKTETPETKNNGERVRDMYYDIHVGQILGFPGRLAMFFACIIVASMPVTGFLIWYGRKKKSRKPATNKSRPARLSIQV